MTDGTFWMTAKRDGECAECEDAILKGERIVWDPEEFKAYCMACGVDVAGPEEEDDGA